MVTDVDETPNITTVGPTYEAPTFDEIEYDAASADLSVVTYAATDEEEEAITWSLRGGDAGDFTIGPTSGLLSFRNRPNFEDPKGTPPAPLDPDLANRTTATRSWCGRPTPARSRTRGSCRSR